MTKYLKDVFGREIDVDDYITYGAGRGGISWGKVVEIKRKIVERHNWQTRSNEWIEEVKLKVAIVPYYKDSARFVTLTSSCSIVIADGDVAHLIKQGLDAHHQV